LITLYSMYMQHQEPEVPHRPRHPIGGCQSAVFRQQDRTPTTKSGGVLKRRQATRPYAALQCAQAISRHTKIKSLRGTCQDSFIRHQQLIALGGVRMSADAILVRSHQQRPSPKNAAIDLCSKACSQMGRRRMIQWSIPSGGVPTFNSRSLFTAVEIVELTSHSIQSGGVAVNRPGTRRPGQK